MILDDLIGLPIRVRQPALRPVWRDSYNYIRFVSRPKSALFYKLIRPERDAAAIATVWTNAVSPESRPVSRVGKVINDLRTWHPLGDARPLFINQRDSTDLVLPEYDPWKSDEKYIRRLKGHPSIFSYPYGHYWQSSLPSAVAFKRPKDVDPCVKRYARRRAMFSGGYAGVGMSPNWFGKRHYTELSRIGC